VDRDGSFAEAVGELLDGAVVVSERNVTEAIPRLSEREFDLALLGPSYAHEAGVAECSLLLDVAPQLAMVLVSDALTTPLLRAALRAGFRDVIEAPLTSAKLEDALGNLEKQQRRHAGSDGAITPSRLGKVVTIISPKGGAGKTVTATNVAMTLGAWTSPERVVVMDADLQFGDVCLAMQIDPRTSMVDIARNLEKLDEPLMESVLARHSSGMRVLPAPLEPALADEVSTQAIVRMLAMLKGMFDYVVIDTAPFLDEPVLSILERSDDVLLVVDMDLPSVKNAKLALDTLRLIKYPMEKISLVLNRSNSKARLDIEELQRSLGLTVKAAVLSDKLVPRSVNEGVPVVALYPRSRVARGFHDVARLVVDPHTVPEAARRLRRRRAR
jgi:pilus assembly protein CpaE